MSFNLKTAKIGFDTVGPITVLCVTKNGEPIVSYTSEWKGNKYVSFRKLWQDDGTGKWMPGKGLALGPDDVAQFYKSVADCAKPKAVKGKVGKGRAA